MKSLLSIALLALLVGATACETVVDVPEPEHTPALAVRYSVSTLPADDSVTQAFLGFRQLYVSASQRLFDTRPIQALTTATARLYDDGAGGALVEEFQAGQPYGSYRFGPDTAGYYVPTRGFQPQPGGSYRLQVEAAGYATVESRLTLPPAPPQLTGGTFTPKPSNNGPGFRQGKLVVTIQDDPATTDYYVAFARVLDAAGQPLATGYVNEDYDENGSTDFQGGRLLLSNPYGNGGLYPYADTDVSGRAFMFSADVSVSTYDPFTGGSVVNPQLEVVISRVTRDTYQFWLSQQRYYNANGNPFAEPAPLHSNIQPGFGIFGGFVDATVRLPLP